MISLTLGGLGWLIATLIFRLWGQFFLDPNNLVLTITLFVAAVGLVGMMAGIYQWQKVDRGDRPTFALGMALPGMLLDVGSVLYFPIVFPNLAPTTNVLFAALMLWGYSMILLSGYLPAGKLNHV